MSCPPEPVLPALSYAEVSAVEVSGLLPAVMSFRPEPVLSAVEVSGLLPAAMSFRPEPVLSAVEVSRNRPAAMSFRPPSRNRLTQF
ncbi:MAG: hypothetical protein IKN03_01000 [Fibrobacter sp.]|nr:hypothetical protein [Fibrobacter sp.]